MRVSGSCKVFLPLGVMLLALFASVSPAGAECPSDDSGLQLPPGFCATVFADNIGHSRQLVVAPNGVAPMSTRGPVPTFLRARFRVARAAFWSPFSDKNGTGKAGRHRTLR